MLLRVRLASFTSTVGLPATPLPLVTVILVDPAVSVLPTNVSADVWTTIPFVL